MKKITAILLWLLCAFLPCSSQIIRIHSITEKRLGSNSTGERPYTLDDPKMADQRAKLLNTANFGGVYPKMVRIIDDYPNSNGFLDMPRADSVDLLFIGTFNLNDPAMKPFTSDELDSLYKWSLSGGKLIHAGMPIYMGQNLSMFSKRWGFQYKWGAPSNIIPTELGKKTLIFNGWFGSVGEALQGGASQGYFSVIPPDAAVLGVNSDSMPTLVLDCKTLDLFIADVDAYTTLSPGSKGPGINNAQDAFLANSIVYMDQLKPEAPPKIEATKCALYASGGTSWQWYYNGQLIAGADSSFYEPVKNGDYRVEILTSYGCKLSSSIKFYKPVPEPKKDTSICKNLKVPLYAGSAHNYLWSSGEETETIVVNKKGTYKVWLESFGCVDSTEFNIDFLSLPVPDLGSGYHICELDSELIKLDAGHFYKYKWTPSGDTSRYYIVTKPSAHFVVVTDFNGCKGEAGTIIKSMCPTYLYVPNSFSPNSDQLNDVFRVSVEYPVEKFQMDIYNRWGEKIFSTNNEFEGWDGTYSGNLVSEGVYFYRINYIGYTHKLHLNRQSLSGQIHLIR